jgi:transketolase
VTAATSQPSAGAGEPAAADQLAVDTIRCLAMDAVQQANSGHPGLPMAMAPVAYVLYTRFLNHDPADPRWPDRDRFVLSAGHGSMLLYAMLHLCGYDLTLEELKGFRQWGTRTPGHPEHGLTPGVETTTGPLGQGFANGVGMALAERFLRMRYGSELIDHRIFAICSDGDLMEGLSAEAASLAGHLGLGRLIYLYDNNGITIDGDTRLSFSTEDVPARFHAYGWHTATVQDANDLPALVAAIEEAILEEDRPSLISVRSVIGYSAPTKQGTSAAHGSPLGEDEVRAAKLALGWDPDRHFHVPESVRSTFAHVAERGERARAHWSERFVLWQQAHPELSAEWERAWAGQPEPGLAGALPHFDASDTPQMSTRVAGGQAMAAFAPHVPTMVGGAADLVESTRTELPGGGSFSRVSAGANIHWGVREHAMGACVNGLALHGGIVKPYGSTFLVFSDYMRPAIRLSALMGLNVVWVFSHDSVAVGEDGPTHQPIEHYAALRAIPGLTVIRPADANETVQAWELTLEWARGPVCLLLTRQNLPVLDPAPGSVALGGYVVRAGSRAEPDVVLLASGSEVIVALCAADLLERQGHAARVVSMPSWQLFDAQDESYRRAVLVPGVPAVSVEAGVSQGWVRYAASAVAIDRFGASAPGGEVLARLGITAEAVVDAAARAIAADGRS